MDDFPTSEYRSRTRRSRPPEPWWTNWLPKQGGQVWLIALAVVVGVILLFSAAEALGSTGRVHPGVTVGGVRVGGLSKPAAQAKLQIELARKAAAPVVVTVGGSTWKTTAGELGLKFDYPALAEAAFSVGRSGGFVGSVGQRLGAWFRTVSLPASPTAESDRLGALMDSIDSSVAVAPKNAGVHVSGLNVVLVPSSKGRALDRAAFERLLLAAFTSNDRTVAAPVAVVDPAVDDASAQPALHTAKAFVSGPALVTFRGKTWTFSPEQVSRWIAFSSPDATQAPGSVPATLEAYIASEEVSSAIRPKVGVVGVAPRNASFTTRAGVVTIVPSKDGTGPDVVALSKSLTVALADPTGPRSASLRISRLQPKITTEIARGMGIKERISTFTTSYDSGNAPRVNNIHTLGDALDGKLVPPGGVFSFNGYVGERTAAKGYKEANAIVAGKLVPQLGGGICQVGTTMFNTVFFSGMPVLERQNHSFYISHYPKGRDATVSWGGPDLRWRNDTKSWMLISVSYTSSSITISLYGTDPGYQVTYTTSDWRNIRPFPTENVKDPTLVTGAKFVSDKGEKGMTCTVVRTVTSGGTVVRVDNFVSDYSPKVEVVHVGTAPKPALVASSTPTPKH